MPKNLFAALWTYMTTIFCLMGTPMIYLCLLLLNHMKSNCNNQRHFGGEQQLTQESILPDKDTQLSDKVRCDDLSAEWIQPEILLLIRQLFRRKSLSIVSLPFILTVWREQPPLVFPGVASQAHSVIFIGNFEALFCTSVKRILDHMEMPIKFTKERRSITRISGRTQIFRRAP